MRSDSRPVAHNWQACELACRGVPCSAPFFHLLAQVVVGEQKAETENVFVGGRNRCVGSWSMCDGVRLPVLGCEAGGGALARCFQLAPGRPSLSKHRSPGQAPWPGPKCLRSHLGCILPFALLTGGPTTTLSTGSSGGLASLCWSTSRCAPPAGAASPRIQHPGCGWQQFYTHAHTSS